MLSPLEGFVVGVTADRRADEQSDLLVRRGAHVLHGPVIRTLPLGPDDDLRDATAQVIECQPDYVIATMVEQGGFGSQVAAPITLAARAHHDHPGPRSQTGTVVLGGARDDGGPVRDLGPGGGDRLPLQTL